MNTVVYYWEMTISNKYDPFIETVSVPWAAFGTYQLRINRYIDRRCDVIACRIFSIE